MNKIPWKFALITLAILPTLIVVDLGVRRAFAQVPPQASPLQGATQRPGAIWEFKALTRSGVAKLAPKPVDDNLLDNDHIDGPAFNPNALTLGLNILGDQGWDLVGIEPYHETPLGSGRLGHPPTYILKRKK